MITYKDLLSNTIDKKKNEADFQLAYSNNDKEAMWWAVFYTCSAICKNIYKSRSIIVDNEELYGTILDSTAYCMEFILNRGVHPEKLSSYCYLRCIKFIDNPKRVFWDKLNNLEFETQKLVEEYTDE